MQTDRFPPASEVESFALHVPEAALSALSLRLGRARAAGEAWTASMTFGVPLDALAELVDYWMDAFDFRAIEARLNELPLHRKRFDGAPFYFVHARSPEPGAIPLLLLHGGSGSAVELEGLIGPLTEPQRYGRRSSDAFHVICPALPGFGLSPSGGVRSLADIASRCAELMACLGYDRYLAHGSDVGAGVARQLSLREQRLAGAHLTSCPAFPGDDPLELAGLSGQEKSQLALLTELELNAARVFVESPIEQLALATTQLLDLFETNAWGSSIDQLLGGLTLNALAGDWELQAQLREQSRRPMGSARTPLGICTFPLDVPCLRRFAERHHRIVSWEEYERGGQMPALEQPALLLESLLRFAARFR